VSIKLYMVSILWQGMTRVKR